MAMNIDYYKDAASKAISMWEAGVKVQEVLNYLTIAAETASYGSTCSILLLDGNGLLRNGASPGLPSDYLKAIDGLKPDPFVGTCAAAAATGSIIMTPDFTADNKWNELRHLPMALGFTGAWSMPIKSPDEKVLGTFGTYYRKKQKPDPTEIDGMKLLAEAVGKILAVNSETTLKK